MTETPKRTVSGESESGIRFSVEFADNSFGDIVREYFKLKSVVGIIEAILELREKCTELNMELYKPRVDLGNQMMNLCLAAAASYPNKMPSAFITEKLNIPFNSYKVYATAKTHESSKYLIMDEDKGVHISPEGVCWVRKMLSE